MPVGNIEEVGEVRSDAQEEGAEEGCEAGPEVVHVKARSSHEHSAEPEDGADRRELPT